jgi:putative ABC transport system permease protein
MVKAFHKTIYRMFKSNIGRFVANFLIVLISIAISAGLANIPSMYTENFSKNYSSGKAADIILKEKTGVGFTSSQLEEVKSDKDVEDAYIFTCIDAISDDEIYRFYVMNLHTDMNKLELVDGGYPTTEYDVFKSIDVLAEQGNKNRNTYEIGDEVEVKTNSLSVLRLSSLKFNVVGIVNNPLYNSVQKENANLSGYTSEELESTYIDAIFYVDESLVPDIINLSGFEIQTSSILVKTDMYIKYKNTASYFTDAYKNEMEEKKNSLVNKFGEDNVVGLTLEENVSYALFKNYNQKVSSIVVIFPFFFILVSALVNSITISRLIEDERKIIATYVSLGISKPKIVLKYLLFTLVSTSLGSIFGLIIGVFTIPTVVLPAYNSVFEMNSLVLSNLNWYSIVSAVAVVLVALLVTLFSAVGSLRETPSLLMLDKAPKPGKKILLQRIPFLWKPLSFRYKSSLRNIFLRKKNLILTSLSIIGAGLLIFVGLALLDVSESLKNDVLFGNVASSMGLISFVIIMFAVAMGIVVVYSLTNMNISERKRELATLKVLGYHEVECLLYSFREIFIISLAASIIGLPLSALIVAFVFNYLEFGSIEDVRWYSYLITFLLVNAMTVIINFLLYPKIKRIDMNDSLKTLE